MYKCLLWYSLGVQLVDFNAVTRCTTVERLEGGVSRRTKAGLPTVSHSETKRLDYGRLSSRSRSQFRYSLAINGEVDIELVFSECQCQDG